MATKMKLKNVNALNQLELILGESKNFNILAITAKAFAIQLPDDSMTIYPKDEGAENINPRPGLYSFTLKEGADNARYVSVKFLSELSQGGETRSKTSGSLNNPNQKLMSHDK